MAKKAKQSPESSQDAKLPKAWWLSTRRRRSEWQELTAAGSATFTGRPRAHFEAAAPGDPVLLYVSKSDHSIRAVGIVAGSVPAPRDAGRGADAAASQLEVQLAFELANPLPWQDIASCEDLTQASPVRQRSSGSLFALSGSEYKTLRSLIQARNPKLEGAFAALESGQPPRSNSEGPPLLREREIDYATLPREGAAARPRITN